LEMLRNSDKRIRQETGELHVMIQVICQDAGELIRHSITARHRRIGQKQ